MFIHVVKANETLWQIANTYRVDMNEIARINELPNPNQLVMGLALVIPGDAINHTVLPGESLWQIAQKYGTTLQAILQANNLSSSAVIYPGQVLIIPSPRYEKPVIDVNGYIYMLGAEAPPIVRQVGQFLTYLSPFAYLIKEDGSLQQIEDAPALEAGRLLDVIPMMAITNFTATARGENLASIVLNNPQIVEGLISNILDIMKQKGYQGLNIDFENVLPRDRAAYNRFLERVVARLHPQGFFVSTALAPKISAQQAGLLYEAHDYEAHGRIVDFVILMTYEWGWRFGPPQAISPVNEIRRVLDYAITVIPRNKIFLGFQIYARDWIIPHVPGSEAETFSNQEAMLRAIRFGAPIQFDPVSQTPFFRYADEQGRGHEVWFEDARSAQAKFNLAKNYGLRGISYWALGYPFPQNWALLNDSFTIRKGNSR